MIDWTAFASGVAGALVGAAIVFGVFSVWRHRRHRRKRHDAVRLIESELRSLNHALLADEVSALHEMSPATRLQLAHAVNCIGSLRGFDGGKGRHVVSWASGELEAMLTTPDSAIRPRIAATIVEGLTEWDERRRGWKWFRDTAGSHGWHGKTPDSYTDELDARLRGNG